MFTPEILARLCPHADPRIAAAVAPALEQAAVRYGVVTILRRAHLIAQLAHESAGFTRLVEDLDYSAPRIAAVWQRLASRARELEHRPEALANAVYSDRLGNGDE